ncbi:MAG: hypothetical protein AAF664_25865 [Planctomycetota bacterium]
MDEDAEREFIHTSTGSLDPDDPGELELYMTNGFLMWLHATTVDDRNEAHQRITDAIHHWIKLFPDMRKTLWVFDETLGINDRAGAKFRWPEIRVEMIERFIDWLGNQEINSDVSCNSDEDEWLRSRMLLSGAPQQLALAGAIKNARFGLTRGDALLVPDAFPKDTYGEDAVKKKVDRINNTWQSATPPSRYQIVGNGSAGYKLVIKENRK